MQTQIQARGFPLTESLRRHAERRLDFAIGSMQGRLRSVSVRLSDENGPRGGHDKLCLIHVSVPGAAPVVIEDVESDLYVAIDRAADRLGRALARRLQRQHRERRANGRAYHVQSSGTVDEPAESNPGWPRSYPIDG